MNDARGTVYLARDAALKKAAYMEKWYRAWINFLCWGVGAWIILTWDYFSELVLFILLVSVILLRVIANVFVSRWCTREIQRIKERLPFPEEASR